MKGFLLAFPKCLFLFLIAFAAQTVQSQAPVELKVKDFAIWGGSAAPGSYNSAQGVFLKNASMIEGNIGSNHMVDIENNLNLKGNIYSGNRVEISNTTRITGDIFANRAGTNLNPAISLGNDLIITGNLTANGRIAVGAGTVTGTVGVPAPTNTNYTGPAPSGGFAPTVVLPVMPTLPANTPFDGQVAPSNNNTNISKSQRISEGVYRKLSLSGNQTLTFNGPGNYIFYEVDNASKTNNLVFDFLGTTEGSINIFIIKDARWGNISVNTINGNFPSRIFTEVHGTGSSYGNAFSIEGAGAMVAGRNAWMGNVWAPNGAILIDKTSLQPNGTPHIIGGLWSGKRVEIKNDIRIVYQAAAVGTGLTYIEPYVPAPVNGKVLPANNKVGAELTSLIQNTVAISAIQDNEMFILDGQGNVMIEVISNQSNDYTLNTLRPQLVTLGMTNIVNSNAHKRTITGNFPINRLSQLAGIAAIQFIRPLFPPISNTGLITSQGDVTMRSNTVRDRFGLTGTNVKIGVISDSYDAKAGAQTDVNEGDLPGVKSNGQQSENPDAVQVVEDLIGSGNDEGRAMLQIVHDIAPKAKLAFSTGFLSAGHFADAIRRLASPTLEGGRCDIIVDDLTYITEPFQRDGVIAEAVNEVVAQGVTYFTSAGNFGNKSYESEFRGVTNSSVIATGQVHRFGATAADLYQTINLKPGSYTIVLQWSDEFRSLGTSGVQTDMDLYLVNANGYRLFGFNRSNISGDPFEICAFTVRDTTNAKLMVVRAAGTSNVRFKYIIFRGDPTILNYQTGTSTVVGHANADSAIAVGAMLYANVPPFTPVWPGVASFSSRGGTVTLTGSTFGVRNKPDLVAPNGVNTSVNLGGAQFNDGDTYPNFFGTSAAAPHAAGVAALLVEGRKKFNLQALVAPHELRQQLKSSAGRFPNISGEFSFDGGYGYIQADSAMAQIANAKPIISTLEPVVPGAQGGTDPFQVRIAGRYFAPNSQIYVDNVPVPTTISTDPATGISTATATVNAIPSGQDPAFQIFNPAKSVSGLDGGLSESLRFFSSGVLIIVKAENKSRRYGQENPVLTAQISVKIGDQITDIKQTSLSLFDLKLDNLVLGTFATSTSTPRSYGISIARANELPADDPLLSQYSFRFETGTLTVEKMTLKITPESKTIKYGDDLNGITYTYQFDTAGVVAPHLLEEVKALHTKYLAANGLIVLNGFSSINSQIAPFDLTNIGAMASFQSVLNARKFTTENGQLKAPPTAIDIAQIGEQRFIVDVSAQSLLNYRSDPAKSMMVQASPNLNARAFLNLKVLTNGSAESAVPGEDFVPMVNGQLLAMVNGQLRALVNGQLRALVNNVWVDASDITFVNGHLRALVNGIWTVIPNGQLRALVNGQEITVELSLLNGQLRALVNGQEMTLENGELTVNVSGQQFTLANGQLRALVNAPLTPLVNGRLLAIVNGELQPALDGQLVAIINGLLLVLVDDTLQVAEDLSIVNGQLRALVNGQLRALVNGQLRALVNGVLVDVPTTSFSLVNGQLRALVNGQEVAYVNGQLRALVNGQLRALVNGDGVAIDSVTQFANGQLRALVNGYYVPIANGQLRALVNGQLLSMVNGQLMAVVNGQVVFIVLQNGQLRALVNQELVDYPNGDPLKAIVNGQLQEVNSYVIENGQLRAIVNGEQWVYPNGQLKAIVNGQLRALVNNFDVSGPNNNAKTLVLVDEDDINLQAGDLGGMISMNMITGLEAGSQVLMPGAFVNSNFEVTYGVASVLITKKPLVVTAENKTRRVGEPNPPFTTTYSGFAFDDTEASVCQPIQIPPTTKVVDLLEKRTTYTDVRINGTSNVYYATPGENLTLTGSWNQVYFSDLIPGYVPYCPGCITQMYIGMSNDDQNGNNFDVCYDISGTFPHAGVLNNAFVAPTRPGVYYITQKTDWWFYCYQFGHIYHEQDANNAIAVVVVEPANGVSNNTTATLSSPAGNYPIVVGGCYFNSNYRIIFQDGNLEVTESTSLKSAPKKIVSEKPTEPQLRKDMLYPNPATLSVRMQLNKDVRNTADIRIYDGVGKLKSAPLRRISEGNYEINISALSRGIYIIEAKTASGTKTFKFIKI
ncbi:MBG domain-containing protein [Flavitalea antarctica]